MEMTGTLSWRDEKPVFVERAAPCAAGCPAGENIRAWVSLLQAGDDEGAWHVLTEVNPLPACMGRICYHPCETVCNRTHFDGAVNVNALERFLGDEAIRRKWRFAAPAADTGKRILVVGAGPSGLSAAYHLRRLGHTVVVRDSAPEGGGMMRYGIPAYRLPREVLDAELDRIADMGVTMQFGTKVDDVVEAMAGFDAAYLAVGAHIGKRVQFSGTARTTVIDAVTMLRAMATGDQPCLGRRVIVYGGGNTALDAARTARRLGSEVTIVYRRTRAMMPAHALELEQTLEEGVAIRWLTTIKAVNDDGTLVLEDMVLDAAGFPQPAGRCQIIGCDTIVLALGQDADLALVHGHPGIGLSNGLVQVGADMMTTAPGVFAGGDMARLVRTATVGVGDGRNAALHIDGWLRGESLEQGASSDAASFDKLHLWYYPPAVRHDRAKRDAGSRVADFAEVVGGLDEAAARAEASRCMSCGRCFDCGSCRDVCPEDAIVRPGAEIELGKCTTCKLCIKECPCGAIAVAPR